MIRQLPSILCWLGFVFVTLFAVVDHIKLGSAQHVYGTAVFLLLILIMAIMNSAKTDENDS